MLTFPELLARCDGPPIGTFVKIPAIEVVEILKLSGYDFIVIDGEHAPLSMRDINHMIAVARSIDLPPLVRVPDHGYRDVQRVLDAGAAGIFVPHVSNGAEAEKVVRQMIHPPLGTRGAGGGMRAGDWGRTSTGRTAYAQHEDILRVLMIEEERAVEAADQILRTPGVSAVFLGPGDLSMTMGMKPTDPPVQEAIQTVFKKAKAANVLVGTVARDGAGAKRLVDVGYDFILASNDTGLLGDAASRLIREARD